MRKRKISITPIEPLEIEFSDGTIKTAVFNNEAFMTYLEEFGDIEVDLKSAEENPYQIMSRILYCGMKNIHPNTTLDEAEAILFAGGIDLIMEISDLIIDNFYSTTNEETLKKFQEMLTPEQKKAVEMFKKM